MDIILKTGLIICLIISGSIAIEKITIHLINNKATKRRVDFNKKLGEYADVLSIVKCREYSKQAKLSLKHNKRLIDKPFYTTAEDGLKNLRKDGFKITQ